MFGTGTISGPVRFTSWLHDASRVAQSNFPCRLVFLTCHLAVFTDDVIRPSISASRNQNLMDACLN